MSLLRTFYLGLCLLLLVGCDRDEISSISEEALAEYEQYLSLDSTHQVRLTTRDEPGTKLNLCLRFIDRANQSNLTNQEVLIYHTNAAGDYEASNLQDASTARIRGKVQTNEEGLAFIQTILPGNYATRGDGRHIHTELKGASPKYYDIHFKQYTGWMGKRFIRRSSQHFLADLKYLENKELIAFLTIEGQFPNQ